MSDIFTLVQDPERTGTPDAEATPPATKNPFGTGGFSTPTAGLVSKPAATAKPKGKPKKGGEVLPYKPLPAPKPEKKLSAGAQKRLDKAHDLKVREAKAAAMRINGVDGDIEIPKKPFLTFFSGKRAKPPEVSEALTDLATMLENGQSERSSVETIAKQYGTYDIGQAFERVGLLLDEGVTLANSIADQEDNFPPVVRELIGTAQVSKDLHRNLRQAAVIILEAGNIKAKIRGALFKPGFLAFFLLAFTFAAIQWFLPMTAALFTGIGAEAPASTTIIMHIGASLKWFILAAIIGVVVFAILWTAVLRRTERGAILGDTFAMKAPMVGDITRMATAARMCDVLAACLGVGMSELEALETAGRASGNKALQAWIDEHVGRQRYGIVNFADVSETELLPWNFRNRIQVTTSITKRVEVLQELGKSFHEKSQDRLNRFAERVGPLSEGVVILVILGVVMLVMAPVMSYIPTLIHSVGG